MILKLIQSILKGSPDQGTRPANDKKAELLDLANETLKTSARDLERLINIGLSGVERRKFKERVKKKVSKVIADEFSDPEIIEEVTERITNAAEFDQYYREMIEKE